MPRERATPAMTAAYWRGFENGRFGLLGAGPTEPREAQEWKEGKRLGALCAPRPLKVD